MVFLGVIICLFGSAAYGQYCSASGGGEQYVSAVIVGTLANTGTGSDGYVDYTSMSTTISLGESQIATIINGLSITGSQCGIWVDWNADSDFDDAGETIAMSGGPALFTGTITAPGETTSGDKRMRVRIMGTGSLAACGDTTYGEVEDYTIAVVAPWTGSGDANDPYQIWTAADMNAIGASSGYWGAHFKLMADIDLSAYTGTSFNIIGYWRDWYFPNNKPFTGVFDGNGRTISNFTYSSTGKAGIGLFGYVNGPNAEIKDLGLIAPNVDAGENVGSLLGFVGEGTVSGCYVEGGSVSGGDHVGGLVGYSNGIITNCYSTGSVSGTTNVGGLVAMSGGTISNCHSSGSVSETGTYSVSAGGLVGTNSGTISYCYSSASVSSTSTYISSAGGLVGYNPGQISNSYATGSVSGGMSVGGLVGTGGIITNCYATAAVLGNDAVGGLVGSGGTVYSSFWDIQTSGQTTSAGGEGKTTAQMKDPNTYLYWGCGLLWTIDAGVDYPRLWWENAPGEVIDTQLSDFIAGAGTESEPYLIYTAEELNLIGLFWCEFDKHFKLMADIDLSGYSGTSFNIIGYSGLPFTGVFDGNGHTISDFTNPPKGLFGVVDGPGAEIKDLGFIDPNIAVGNGSGVGPLARVLNDGTISGCYVEGGSLSGNATIGGLVGKNGGTITNCYSTAAVSGRRGSVGGLVGNNEGTITNCYSTGRVHSGGWSTGEVGGLVGVNSGTITNCYSEGDVSGRWDVGGLVGDNDGIISKCYALGSVSATQERVGGLVAENHGTGTITNCYSTGNVSGDFHVGGLVGRTLDEGTISNCYALGSVSAAQDRVGGLVGDHHGTMTNCYSIGSVTGTTDVGGVVGWNEGSVSACFWDTQTSGRTNMCGSSQYGASGCDDDNGKTTAEMQTESTFIDAGWDFVDIWDICEGTNYPRFLWQIPLGDFLCPDGVDWNDVAVLCEQWLKTSSTYLIADIAPTAGGDGIVNMRDFAALANNWLAGVE